MKKLEYTVIFTTPAFLGNAEQSGQWRTPPFKALLRQWWRVTYAADHGFRANMEDMRRDEGLLFGHAWLDNDRDEKGRQVAARKSLVRIRLDSWAEGQLEKNKWQPLETVSHPEVHHAVGSDLYLGYGPVILPRGAHQPTLKAHAAIQVGENARLSVALPSSHRDPRVAQILEANGSRIDRALWLMGRYGTLGGRSRNGWGSFALIPLRAEGDKGSAQAGDTAFRPWRDCLDSDWDWPHAIGLDDNNRPLIWQTTKSYDDWKSLMRDLAIVKIGLRTQFLFPNSPPPHPSPLERHWLSYPITRHTTKAWKGNMRLPNSIRFKVRPDGAEPTKLRGVILHLPCLPPADFRPDRKAVERTWRQVHALLDQLSAESNRSYPMISNTARRDALKPQLDKVTLERISE